MDDMEADASLALDLVVAVLFLAFRWLTTVLLCGNLTVHFCITDRIHGALHSKTYLKVRKAV